MISQKLIHNYGIDLLKIVAMFLVLLLHILGHGGILGKLMSTPPELLSKYGMAWLIEIIAYCSVNCFALTTGYNYYGKKPHWSNLINLLFQIIFYSSVITIIFLLFGEKITYNIWLKTFLPVLGTYNWYITSYAGMFVFIPMMNKFLDTTNMKDLKIFLFILFIWFSILPTIFALDPFRLVNGYSMLWLCILYLLGGTIKKYSLNKLLDGNRALIYFIIVILVSWLLKISIDHINILIDGKIVYGSRFIKYISPLIVGSSVFIFIYFANLNIKNNFIIKFIKLSIPTYFGIYIIHLHPIIWNKYIKNCAVSFVQSNCIVMIMKIFLTAILIYITLSFIDYLRLKLFDYLSVNNRIKNFCNKIEVILLNKI